MDFNGRPRPAPWVEVEQLVDGQLKLVARNSADSVLLNESSASIWNQCDGHRTVTELIDYFATTYPDHPAIGKDVSAQLQTFSEQGLIVLDGGTSALEYGGAVVKTLTPGPELQWQLELIRQFLFGVLRLEEAEGLDADLEVLLGQAALENAMKLDADTASMLGDSRVIPYSGATKSPSFKAALDVISGELKKLIPEVKSDIEISGNAIYLKNSHMGWHSNHSRSDGRIYCSWAQKPHTNFFRYQDPLTGEIVTHREEPGWNIKSFTIPPSSSRFWHCIGAGSLRLSLGFRYSLPEKSSE